VSAAIGRHYRAVAENRNDHLRTGVPSSRSPAPRCIGCKAFAVRNDHLVAHHRVGGGIRMTYSDFKIEKSISNRICLLACTCWIFHE
jgi:hypothetical protein